MACAVYELSHGVARRESKLAKKYQIDARDFQLALTALTPDDRTAAVHCIATEALAQYGFSSLRRNATVKAGHVKVLAELQRSNG